MSRNYINKEHCHNRFREDEYDKVIYDEELSPVTLSSEDEYEDYDEKCSDYGEAMDFFLIKNKRKLGI